MNIRQVITRRGLHLVTAFECIRDHTLTWPFFSSETVISWLLAMP